MGTVVSCQLSVVGSLYGIIEKVLEKSTQKLYEKESSFRPLKSLRDCLKSINQALNPNA
jgi:hypothetical protein